MVVPGVLWLVFGQKFRLSVRPSVPPLAGPQTLLAGPQTPQASPQTHPVGPQTPPAGPQPHLNCLKTHKNPTICPKIRLVTLSFVLLLGEIIYIISASALSVMAYLLGRKTRPVQIRNLPQELNQNGNAAGIYIYLSTHYLI